MNNLFKTVYFCTLQDDWVMLDPEIISRTANTITMGKKYSSLIPKSRKILKIKIHFITTNLMVLKGLRRKKVLF